MALTQLVLLVDALPELLLLLLLLERLLLLLLRVSLALLAHIFELVIELFLLFAEEVALLLLLPDLFLAVFLRLGGRSLRIILVIFLGLLVHGLVFLLFAELLPAFF